MDVLICLGAKDIFFVRKTVREIRRYICLEGTIFIVTSSRLFKYFGEGWLKRNCVVLVDENNMLKGLSLEKVYSEMKRHFSCAVRAGWYFQQFLKMSFALTQYAKENYLIWDADTIPLRTIKFIDEKGRFLFTMKEEYNRPYFETMHRLLGFGKVSNSSFIAEHMPIKTSIMAALLDEIEKSTVVGASWFEKIINATSGVDEAAFSEFETYGTYCQLRYPDIFQERELRTLREAGMLYGRGVRQNELTVLSKMGFDTASFETYHIPLFPRNMYNSIERKILKFI